MSPFERLLADLVRSDVVFVTVGGVACAMAGVVRTTEDVGILVAADEENLGRLLAALLRFGEGYARELTVADFTDEEGAIRIVEDFPLDVFTRMGGRRYEDVLPYVRRLRLDEVEIPYLAAEGLIAIKGESLRARDRADVAVLRALLERDS